jgi:hypothetical protein
MGDFSDGEPAWCAPADEHNLNRSAAWRARDHVVCCAASAVANVGAREPLA